MIQSGSIPKERYMEEWKTCLENNNFEVSSFGNVRSKHSTYQRIHKGKLVTSAKKTTCVGNKLSPKGYLRINLNGKVKFVHSVVANNFLIKPENKSQVNHKNGKKTDNRVENLEWVSNQENRDHAVFHGLIAKGEKLSKKLKKEDVIKIRELCLTNKQKDVGLLFNVCQQNISSICNNKSWRFFNE